MVRKANTKSVASKKVVKAEPKARPIVKYTKQTLTLPEGNVDYDAALAFIKSAMKPMFGKISKGIEAHNAAVTEECVVFFRAHRDSKKTGTYSFVRHAPEMIFVFQTVEGVVAQLTILTDFVRRGPKSIEYISGVKDWGVKEEYLEDGLPRAHKGSQPINPDALAASEAAKTSGVQVDPALEAAQAEKVSYQPLPNLFHHGYEQLKTWLQDFTNNVSLVDDVKTHVASLVKAATQSGVVTEEMMSRVVFSTNRAAALFGVATISPSGESHLQLQLFSSNHAGVQAPFGVIDLGSVWLANHEGNVQSERLARVISARQNPFGEGVRSDQRKMEEKHDPYGAHRWVSPQDWHAQQRQQGAFGGMHPAAFKPSTTFFDHNRAAGAGASGAWSSHGGYRNPADAFPNNVMPEAMSAHTTSFDRFTTLLFVIAQEQTTPVHHAAITDLLNGLRAMFQNQVSTQNGLLSFEFQYVQGNHLLVIVRERMSSRTHLVNQLQLS